MGREIERKFLVKYKPWTDDTTPCDIIQGYISSTPVVRVRLERSKVAARAYLTVKGKQTGITRAEYEYKIPVYDAETMLETLVEKTLHKRRWKVSGSGSHIWEIDEFHGNNLGLVIAEIELDNENDQFDLPDWVGQEITNDMRYMNVNLVDRPWKTWPENLT